VKLRLKKIQKKLRLQIYKLKVQEEKETNLRNLEEFHRLQFLSVCLPCSVQPVKRNRNADNDQVEKRELLSGTIFHFRDPVSEQWGTMRYKIWESVWEIKEKMAARHPGVVEPVDLTISYQGKPLLDRMKMSDYNVLENATVVVASCRLLGGMLSREKRPPSDEVRQHGRGEDKESSMGAGEFKEPEEKRPRKQAGCGEWKAPKQMNQLELNAIVRSINSKCKCKHHYDGTSSFASADTSCLMRFFEHKSDPATAFILSCRERLRVLNPDEFNGNNCINEF
jgi:hypothetical protein